MIKLTFLILSIIAISGCSNPDDMFELHVTDSGSESVKLENFIKDPVMHGALFFEFKSDITGIEEIVKRHRLVAVNDLSPAIIESNEQPLKHVSWWPTNKSISSMKKYCVWYNPKQCNGDWAMRCMYHNDEHAYFVTTGFFDKSSYVTEPITSKREGCVVQ